MNKEWIINFKGRGTSLYYDLNFLWNKGNVYIMDNHRAAMWCWLQEIKNHKKYDLFHLDRHFDTLYSNIDSWLEALPELQNLDITEYLDIKDNLYDAPLIRYDNYLSIFLEKYSSVLSSCWFSTYSEGDVPRGAGIQFPQPKVLPSSLEFWLKESPNKWIINLDIDLFFCEDPIDGKMKLHSDEFIQVIGEILKSQNESGKIEVITIALSPEWCGNWEQAEKACKLLTNSMGINFCLP